MKIGLSSYSIVRALNEGTFDIFGAMDWMKEKGAEHIEIVPFGFDINVEVAKQIKQKGQDIDLDISNYAIGANVLNEDGSVNRKEVDRLKEEVDIAHALGVKRMRHDVVGHRDNPLDFNAFEKDLPNLAEACREIAQYAREADIVTSIENHGFYVQGSDRVSRLIHEVNEPNFRLTLDVGNYLCVDEDPEAAVVKTLDLASIVHFKDFLIRKNWNPGNHWLTTPFDTYLRGSVIGEGDINLQRVARRVAESFDGYVSVEFEGPEDCLWASEISMNNVRRLFAEVPSTNEG
ncbi:sugar phosphate isomerase/epimerase [Bacillaceae bacterium SIJ1]|uniref:sugar phosphate isomerase/epimerase family protein n=1 Tax=Litoribacterium kuwaitense TaxID=1398745 RepID=UPI0013E9F288|nr:sugar phosphate isomerase/epimerase family protein [Litoribacterium kuwaitense]NGP43982.1 sugar phosphate isomerase/epimerase [Litoribacterium kuwaitense]